MPPLTELPYENVGTDEEHPPIDATATAEQLEREEVIRESDEPLMTGQAHSPDASEPEPQGNNIAGSVIRIPLSEIMPSPTNPRKHIEQSEIESLAENIRQQYEATGVGLMQPILVRPLRSLVITWAIDEPGENRLMHPFGPASREKCDAEVNKIAANDFSVAPPAIEVNDDCGYEIVAGERRYRAHQCLNEVEVGGQFAAIDCIVRDLSDQQVLEQQISENLQREDLTPLDWANAYAAMVIAERQRQPVGGEVARSERGAVARVAARLGKSTSVVYQTMQLAKLIPEASTALRKEYITKNHAIDCARLDAEEQLDYLCEALHNQEGWPMFDEHEELQAYLASDTAESPEQVASVRAMREWLDLIDARKNAPVPGTCQYCGCTDDNACSGGCSWVNGSQTVCSNPECVAKFEAENDLNGPSDDSIEEAAGMRDSDAEDEDDDEEAPPLFPADRRTPRGTIIPARPVFHIGDRVRYTENGELGTIEDNGLGAGEYANRYNGYHYVRFDDKPLPCLAHPFDTLEPAPATQQDPAELERKRQAAEMETKALQGTLKRILTASDSAAKRSKKTLHDEDLKLVAEGVFDLLEEDDREAVAQLLRWEVKPYEAIYTSYHRALLKIDTAQLPQFLITCVLAHDLVRNSIMQRRGIWRSFEGRYKIDVNAVYGELKNPGKPKAAAKKPVKKAVAKAIAKKPTTKKSSYPTPRADMKAVAEALAKETKAAKKKPAPKPAAKAKKAGRK
jgi:ParB/RepB/Spo0J family partition protein